MNDQKLPLAFNTNECQYQIREIYHEIAALRQVSSTGLGITRSLRFIDPPRSREAILEAPFLISILRVYFNFHFFTSFV
jgi:hypothetical protein